MTGLSRITDRILDDARAQADEVLARAQEESKKIKNEYAQRAAQIVAECNAQAKSNAAQLVARARSEERTQTRDKLLMLKGEMTSRAFTAAQNELEGLADKQRLSLITRIMISVLTAEYEAEQERIRMGDTCEGDGERIYEILLCRRDLDKLGDELMDSFRRGIVGRDMGDLTSRVRLSGECAKIGTGLVVRIGDIEINCSVESIIASLRQRLEGDVEKILFPE